MVDKIGIAHVLRSKCDLSQNSGFPFISQSCFSWYSLGKKLFDHIYLLVQNISTPNSKLYKGLFVYNSEETKNAIIRSL